MVLPISLAAMLLLQAYGDVYYDLSHNTQHHNFSRSGPRREPAIFSFGVIQNRWVEKRRVGLSSKIFQIIDFLRNTIGRITTQVKKRMLVPAQQQENTD
jgi:hypothetical protein